MTFVDRREKIIEIARKLQKAGGNARTPEFTTIPQISTAILKEDPSLRLDDQTGPEWQKEVGELLEEEGLFLNGAKVSNPVGTYAADDAAVMSLLQQAAVYKPAMSESRRREVVAQLGGRMSECTEMRPERSRAPRREANPLAIALGIDTVEDAEPGAVPPLLLAQAGQQPGRQSGQKEPGQREPAVDAGDELGKLHARANALKSKRPKDATVSSLCNLIGMAVKMQSDGQPLPKDMLADLRILVDQREGEGGGMSQSRAKEVADEQAALVGARPREE